MRKKLGSSARTDIFDFIDATGPAAQASATNKAPIVGSDCPPRSSAKHASVQANISQADVPTRASVGAGLADAATSGGGQAATTTSGETAPQERTAHHKIAADDPGVVLSSHQEEMRTIAAKQHDVDFDVMLAELECVFAGLRSLESGRVAWPTVASKPSFLH